MLGKLVALSHEFGGERYVHGGGGNSSAKNLSRLWIKPSGSAMRDMRADSFVVVDREKMRAFYDYQPSGDWRQREHDLKEIITAAIVPGGTGRPSVETAMHDSFPQTFGLHTHPPLVGGLICSAGGKAFAEKNLPDALWVDVCEPGYTLCMNVRRAADQYRRRHFREPAVVLMQNHGLFVSGNTPEAVRAAMEEVFAVVGRAVDAAGVAHELSFGPEPDAESVGRVFDVLQEVAGDDASVILPSGPFAVPDGAVCSDHVIHARAEAYRGEPTAAGLAQYHARHGYWPRIVVADTGVYGVGKTHKAASFALDHAKDGAIVAQYAGAFGGVVTLSPGLVDFVEQWEVESYRRKSSSSSVRLDTPPADA